MGKRLSQENRLLKRQAQALPGDGIDRTGGVANQRDPAARNHPNAAQHGDRSSLCRRRGRTVQALGKPGKERQGVLKAQSRATGDEGEANLLRANRCDHHLALVAPVDLDEIRPRSYPVVPAKSKANLLVTDAVEAGPLANLRVLSISRNDPAAPDGAPIKPYSIGGNSEEGGSPQERNSGFNGPLHENVVQRGSPDPQTTTVGEGCYDGGLALDEADSPEANRLIAAYLDTEFAQGGNSIRHQAFAAYLVDRGPGGIGNNNPQALLAGSDGCGKSGGSAAGNEYVSLHSPLTHYYQRSNTSSEQKPGPIAASRLSVPGAGRR